MSTTTEVRYCAAPDCGKVTTSNLKCPICLKNGLHEYFCNSTCFRGSFSKHKAIHPKEGVESYNPFPEYSYTGNVKPSYPLSIKREVPNDIIKPDYAIDGTPISELKNDRTNKIKVLNDDEISKMREVCKLGREIIDLAGEAVKPGITTDEIDKIVHNATIERGGYPSPLNYFNYPKSVCTSVNEVICHGIPDKRKLQDGDIINIDVSFYKFGFHADLNETYYVGEKAKLNPDLVRLVETTRESLDLAIAAIKPGVPIREFGNIIQKHADENNVSVVRTYCGHGVGSLFHSQPEVPHYAKNKAIGICKPGICFTIEPMLNLGTYRDVMWPDGWTSTTADGKASAQFEHTLLVTEDGVEVLTARTATSPGGAIPRI
ncbi:Methionine aminopeptidase 1 [Pichia californica]|uniref:Methionine aminopeptidase n=1 Tax=Pichia californica TaxID=460514 RepID=A0A9P7BI31_9ASCO|nr:Methionine aminopeptidase 1 [[Candida] californica]